MKYRIGFQYVVDQMTPTQGKDNNWDLVYVEANQASEAAQKAKEWYQTTEHNPYYSKLGDPTYIHLTDEFYVGRVFYFDTLAYAV